MGAFSSGGVGLLGMSCGVLGNAGGPGVVGWGRGLATAFARRHCWGGEEQRDVMCWGDGNGGDVE